MLHLVNRRNLCHVLEIKPIAIPAGVTIEVKDGIVTVKGKKDTLTTPLVDTTEISVEGNVAKVLSVPEKSSLRLKKGKVSARHGLMRIAEQYGDWCFNWFVKELEFHGIGYKVDVRGKELHLNVGYSNPRIHPIPDRYQSRSCQRGKGSNIETEFPRQRTTWKGCIRSS